MDLTTILAADTAHQNVQTAAQEAVNASADYVMSAIRTREVNQRATKDKLVKIANAERIAAIKESRVPKTENGLKEILERISGTSLAARGNVVVLVVGLGEDSHAKDLVKHVSEFADDATVMSADMYGMNANSDTNPNDSSDAKFEMLINEVASLEHNQASLTCDVLSKRQPFSDIFGKSLKNFTNGN